MGDKVLVRVGITMEVDEGRVGEVIDKIMDIIHRQLGCAASRTTPYVDEFRKTIYIEAEFCHPEAEE